MNPKMNFTLEDVLHDLGLDVNGMIHEGIFIAKAEDNLFTGGLKCCLTFGKDAPERNLKSGIVSACLMSDVS